MTACSLYLSVSRLHGSAYRSHRLAWLDSLQRTLNSRKGFSSTANASLGPFLNSCNLSLVEDACSLLHFQPIKIDSVSRRNGCIRGRLENSAGLGHQMTEVLFYAHLANIYLLPHVFEPFSTMNSAHLSSYDWAVEFFGLESTFRYLGSNFAVSETMNQTLRLCGHFLRLNSEQCDDSMILGIDELTKSSGNCFKSPLMYKLFANFAPCLRQSSLCYGTWVAQARSVQYDPSVVNVAWHIRAGDINHYNSSSSYFR
jgi:hypothetical protein